MGFSGYRGALLAGAGLFCGSLAFAFSADTRSPFWFATPIDGELSAPALLLSNGTFVLTANDGTHDTIHFLDHDGTVASKASANSRDHGLALLQDGSLAWSSDQLYLFSPSGQKTAAYATSSEATSPALPLSGDKIAIASELEDGSGRIEILDSKLEPVAKLSTAEPVESMVAEANGTIVAKSKTHLYFLSPSGTLLNQLSTQAAVSAVSVSGSGIVAWSCAEKGVSFFDGDGRLLSVFAPKAQLDAYNSEGFLEAAPTNESFFEAAAFLSNGNIVLVGEAGGRKGYIHFLSADGKNEIARFDMKKYSADPPAILGDGTVVVASDRMYFFNSFGQLERTALPRQGYRFAHPATLPNNKVAVAQETDWSGPTDRASTARLLVFSSGAEIQNAVETLGEEVISMIQPAGDGRILMGAWSTSQHTGRVYLVRGTL